MHPPYLAGRTLHFLLVTQLNSNFIIKVVVCFTAIIHVYDQKGNMTPKYSDVSVLVRPWTDPWEKEPGLVLLVVL